MFYTLRKNDYYGAFKTYTFLNTYCEIRSINNQAIHIKNANYLNDFRKLTLNTIEAFNKLYILIMSDQHFLRFDY